MGRNQPSQGRLTWKQFLLIATVAFGTLLNPLNSSMIAVALTRLQKDFQLTFSDASWLISTYYLASAIGQPVMGKLSDFLGRKRLFLTGLFLIAAASALAPFSPSFGWLIGFRIIQAVGSSTLFPAGMGIIRKSITQNQAFALGVLSVFSSTSAAFGPSIGGFLIHLGDWPAIFFINFPFIVLSFGLALKVLPKEERVKKQGNGMDVPGIVLFSLMIIGWLLFLLSLEAAVSWWKLAMGIVFTVLFIWYEARARQPFIDVRALKRNLNVSFVYVQFILVNVIFYSIFFGVPTYLQDVLAYDSQTTGLVMLSIAGFGVVVAPLVGRWVDKQGSKPPLIVGSIIVIAGSLLLLAINEHSSAGWIFAILSVLGICNGFNNLGMQTALYAFVPPTETGSASGLFMTSRYLGTILSSSLLGNFFGDTVSTGHFHMIAIACAVIGIPILLLTLRMPGKQAAAANLR